MPKYFKENENIVMLFCNSRGLGAAVRDYLIQRSEDHVKSFARFNQSGHARFTPVTEQLLNQWYSEYDYDGETLIG